MKAEELLEAIHKKNKGKQVLLFTEKEFEALLKLFLLKICPLII